MPQKKQIKTFVSYSHDSIEHKQFTLAIVNQLCAQGINCTLDQYVESPEEGWANWMDGHMTASDYVLVICSEGYADKINGVIAGGKGVKWEGAIISQALYEAEGKNRRFIPVLLQAADAQYIPRMLKAFTYYDISSPEGYKKLYRRLTRQPAIKKPPVGKVVELPPDNVVPFPGGELSTGQRPTVKQSINGQGNVQVGQFEGSLTINSVAEPTIVRLPNPGTIGAHPLLKQAIQERFNKLGDERKKRFGNNAFKVMYSIFKREFELGHQKWSIIWDWPADTASAIIDYLDQKYANTIDGRNQKAMDKGTLIPSKKYSIGKEKKLLADLELEMSSPEVKDALAKYFGVATRTKLTKKDLWHWVLYLEKRVEALLEGEINPSTPTSL